MVIRLIRHFSKVEHKVPNLTKKLILVDVPVDATTIRVSLVRNIRIGIYKRNACKITAALDDCWIFGVTDELSVI